MGQTNPEKQGIDECDYCYLQRIRTLAQNAGLTHRLLRARTGKHRHMKGYDLFVAGSKVAHFKTVPKNCSCKK